MTVTITITDPTATEATALRAYLTALRPADVGFTKLEEPIREHTEWVSNSFFRIEEPIEVPVSDDAPVTAEDAGAPDFDSAGMPWNEKIHASSRATVADGTWRKKRGVSDELVAEVEAGLQAAIDEHAPVKGTVQDVIDQVVPEPTVETPSVPDAPVQEQSGPEVPDVPVGEQVPDTPPPPPAPTANPFLALMSRIGKSKLDKAKKDELLTAAGALDEKGAPSILELNKRPELIDGFIALLDSEGV